MIFHLKQEDKNMFNKISIKKLDTLDFVSGYEIKETGYLDECYLDLYDCNNRYVGTTKNYSREKIEKYVKNNSMCERGK